MRLNDGFDNWMPLSLDDVMALFRDASFLWWIAGGWCIDLFVGRQTRPHADTDVQLLRRDSLAVQDLLRGWEVYAADPPGTLRTWEYGEALERDIHDIWCRRSGPAPWALQLNLVDTDGDTWLYRRDQRIRRPLSEIGLRDAAGRPYLAPEIQLLYKAKGLRPKDWADFLVAAPLLPATGKRWLREALGVAHPRHPWLEHL